MLIFYWLGPFGLHGRETQFNPARKPWLYCEDSGMSLRTQEEDAGWSSEQKELEIHTRASPAHSSPPPPEHPPLAGAPSLGRSTPPSEQVGLLCPQTREGRARLWELPHFASSSTGTPRNAKLIFPVPAPKPLQKILTGRAPLKHPTQNQEAGAPGQDHVFPGLIQTLNEVKERRRVYMCVCARVQWLRHVRLCDLKDCSPLG